MGDLSLKIDVVAIKKRKPNICLPELFWYFKRYNLIQFKPANDSFSPDDYEKLLCYGILFKLKYGIKSRKTITLTAIVPTFSRKWKNYFHSVGFNIQKLREGVYKIKAEFEIILLASQKLEITKSNYPLLLFSSGKQLMKFLTDLFQSREDTELMELAYNLYPDSVKEVFKMQGLNYSEVGIDGKKVINAIIRDFGKEDVIQTIGEEDFIQTIGEKRLLKDLIKMMGKDNVKKMLEE